LFQDMGTTYIGQALSLVNWLNQHNRGIGNLQTLDPRLCPWGWLGEPFTLRESQDIFIALKMV
jgi:hypothetical protein